MAFLLRFSHPLLISFFLFRFCTPINTIIPTQTIDDGETLVSADEKFVLGFFSPGNSTNRYVGIWYNHIRETVVWVANRENPLTNSSGVLTILNGNIVLLDASRRTLWSAINGTDATNYSTARLLDSGNLVLSDNEGRILWESFDHPTDTLLPGMKIGVDRRTSIDRYLTSWKSPNDPAHGEFSLRLDSRGLPQFILWKGSERVWRSGPWNGQRLSGVPWMTGKFIFSFRYVANEHETYFIYNLYNASVISMMVLNGSGELQRLTWLERDHRWNLFWATPRERCDQYAHCGTYAGCNANQVPSCECLHGFEPRSPRDWYLRDWSDGCVRRRPLECEKGDGFFKLAHAKLPDALHARVDTRASLKACEDECLKNCSCTAYSSADINGGGSGCMTWGGDLIDLVVYSDGGQDIYVRVAASELGGTNQTGDVSSKNNHLLRIILPIIATSMVVLGMFGYFLWRRLKKQDSTQKSQLDWVKRFCIVEGIAQGILYLHKYSRLRIIHRDLKASNILLDGEMNPKISDFGLARIFGGNQIEASTDRIMGTYGYMPPEYALAGHFSEKSDVFSFGVLLLEIVTGKRNAGFYPTDQWSNTLVYAWKLWKEGKTTELMDPSISSSYVTHEVERCIHVGLLCVQEDPGERPTMSSVISMLGNGTVLPPMPKKPAFSTSRGSIAVDPSSSESRNYSINDLTISTVEARP